VLAEIGLVDFVRFDFRLVGLSANGGHAGGQEQNCRNESSATGIAVEKPIRRGWVGNKRMCGCHAGFIATLLEESNARLVHHRPSAWLTAVFIFSRPALATSAASMLQYLRLNNSSDNTFCPPMERNARRISVTGATPSPG